MKLTKIEKTIGIILAVLLFLITLSSTFFFLGELRVSLTQWISFNACSPISFLYLLLFLSFFIRRNAICLIITFLPIYFLGTMSMFVLSWNDTNLIVHTGHIIMTLNIVWVITVILKHEEYRALGNGLLISILLFVPYIAYVLSYNQVHAKEISNLFP